MTGAYSSRFGGEFSNVIPCSGVANLQNFLKLVSKQMQDGSQIFFTTIIFHFTTFRYPLLGEKLTENKLPIPAKIRTLFWSFISSYIPGFQTEVQNIYPDRGHISVLA